MMDDKEYQETYKKWAAHKLNDSARFNRLVNHPVLSPTDILKVEFAMERGFGGSDVTPPGDDELVVYVTLASGERRTIGWLDFDTKLINEILSFHSS